MTAKKLLIRKLCALHVFLFMVISHGYGLPSSQPIVDENLVFEEKDGMVAVEAEYFYKQSKTDTRQWYITSKDSRPRPGRDEDPPHFSEASNHAYIEILPDTRVTHDDELIKGENFSNEPGVMGILHYKVRINNPGRYYVYVRAYSTGTEDNGLHVGLDGTWPETGQRLQWCQGKNSWYWDSRQRTEEEHCGVPYEIYLDIEEAGVHDILFSMREDGFEFDKFVLTREKKFSPGSGTGPRVRVGSGALPPPFPGVKNGPD